MYSLLYDGLGASITQGRYNYFIIVCTVFYGGRQLKIGTTYTYQIQAFDPNEDDIVYSSRYDGLGASVTRKSSISTPHQYVFLFD